MAVQLVQEVAVVEKLLSLGEIFSTSKTLHLRLQ